MRIWIRSIKVIISRILARSKDNLKRNRSFSRVLTISQMIMRTIMTKEGVNPINSWKSRRNSVSSASE